MRLLYPKAVAETKIAVTATATELYSLMETAGGRTSPLKNYYGSMGGNAVLITPEDGDIRFVDGAVPTASIGTLLKQGTMYFVPCNLAALKLIRTGSANVNCSVAIAVASPGEGFGAVANTASLTVTADLDGVYDASTNPDPDNSGLIVHENAAAPAKTNQKVRTTGGASAATVASANFHGIDTRSKLYGKSGTDEMELTATLGKLDVNASGTVAVSNTEFPLPSAQVTTLTPIAHPTEFPLPSAQVTTLTPIAHPTEFPLPSAQITTLTPIAHPTEFPLPSAQVTTLTPPAAITGFATEGKQLADNHQVTVSNIASTPVITGFATEAKQLADNHQVIVSNIASTPVITGFATEAKQLADNHQVTVSNIASTPVITGFATEAKQLAAGHDVTVKSTTATDCKVEATIAAAQTVAVTNADLANVAKSTIGPAAPTVDSYGHVAINLTTGANQVLVSSAANKQVWVYGYAFTCGEADGQTVSLQDEDDTAVTGIMVFSQYGGISAPPAGNFSMPLFKLATDKDLEVDITGGDVDGWLAYAIISV